MPRAPWGFFSITDQLADPYFAEPRSSTPDVWPSAPAESREIWLAHLEAVDEVANTVMSAGAVALGMEADHFVLLLDKGPTVMRATTTSGARAPRCRSTARCAWARDAVIECLPTCSEASNPPRHAPVTSGDHLMAKLMGSRLLRRSEQSQRR